jgi:outer membrane protein assembly factor BamB
MWSLRLPRLLRYGPLIAAVFCVATAFGQTDGSQKWAFSTLSSSAAGNILSSPAQAADGTVYVGVEVGLASSTIPSGRLIAIRPDGSQKWSFTTPDWVDSTPTIAPDGTIYFGCWDGNVYALNPDGTKKWSASAGAFVSGSPAVGRDGTLYVGSGSGNLSALNPDGSLKWSFPTADWIDSSPAIGADGTIYFGSWDNNIYAVRPDGTEKWHYGTGGEVASSPALAADGTVYVASRDLSLYALTAYGALKWSVSLTDAIESAPAIGADGTIYVTTTGGRVHAFNPDGSERWQYPRATQAALNAMYSSPAVRADGAIIVGTSNSSLLALRADGTLLWQTTLLDWADSSPLIAADGTIYLGCSDKRLYAFNGNGRALADSPWPSFRRNASRRGEVASIAVATSPTTATVPVGAAFAATASVTMTEGATPTVQWLWNGSVVAGATGPSISLANLQPGNTGIFSAVATNALATARSAPVVLGLATTAKRVGDASEIGADIPHANGNIYDQVLLQGMAATITTDPGQVTRISYVDLSNDIVQVEFAGAGTLSLVLDNASGPAPAVNYDQPSISYMKGHAGIVITGADETTNVSVFSVGRITAVNQALFKPDVTYDGMADLAYIAIASANGKFGGVRAANASFLATKGITGIYAPGVSFTGPVRVGDIAASDTAAPVLVLGSASDTLITGGDLLQPNNRPVVVAGIVQLKFVAGTTSHGTLLIAQTNRAQLEQDNVNVTAQVVLNPSP